MTAITPSDDDFFTASTSTSVNSHSANSENSQTTITSIKSANSSNLQPSNLIKAKNQGPPPEANSAPPAQLAIVDARSDTNTSYFCIQTKVLLCDSDKNSLQNSNNNNKNYKLLKTERSHEDFKWLYHQISTDIQNIYAGYLVPAAPSKPDFSSSYSHNEKYNFALAQSQKSYMLRDRSVSTSSSVSSCSLRTDISSGGCTNKFLEKLKKNCESEYLASFKKCVTDHENFLIKICNHQLFKDDPNLKHFLEDDEKNFTIFKQMSQGKNPPKNFVTSLFNKVVQYSDEQIFKKTPQKCSLGSRLPLNRSLDSGNSSGVSSLNTSAISSNSSSSYNVSPSQTGTVTLGSRRASGSKVNSLSNDIIPHPPNSTTIPTYELSVPDIFHQYYIYFNEKSVLLDRLERICDGANKKQKELGQFLDWFNECLVLAYREQKVVETQIKSASLVNNQSMMSPSLLPSMQMLYKSSLQESRAQTRLANDLDLNLTLNFSTIKKDILAGKSMLYKRLKTFEKLETSNRQFQLESGSSSNGTLTGPGIQTYEAQLLKHKIEILEKEYKKFNEIGQKELLRQESEQIKAIPKIIKEHARLQCKKHAELGLEIKSLIKNLD